MTLDEAIKHCEEVAEKQEKAAKEWHENECKECANEHRQLAEWLRDYKRLKEQEPCEDAVSRKALIERINYAEENFKADNMESIASDNADPFIDGVLSGVFCIREMVIQEPPVTPQPKIEHCKDCKYFEYDSFAKVDGIPLIVAHKICSKWGDGCKTKENGYCFLFEPQVESEEL